MNIRLSLVALLSFVVWWAGGLAAAEEPAAKAPEAPIARAIVREVTDHEDLTGRTEAVARVELRARVTGYLLKSTFQEGAEVKKGDVLFEIEPRLYQADLDKAL